MRLKPLDQQVVVVFGASSGIGRETAARLAEKGAKVVVSARSEDSLDSLVNEIRAKGGTAHAVAAEAADFAQVKGGCRRGRAPLRPDRHLGTRRRRADVRHVRADHARRVQAARGREPFGQVYGAKAALPHLLQAGGGALIHISSVEAMRATPYHAAYAASKHGIHGFLQALRLELIHDKRPVCVTEIMPPAINTPLFNKSRTKLVSSRWASAHLPGPSGERCHPARAEHPSREIVLGGAGKGMLLTQRLSPRLMEP
jgi:short-subunit dehydrogenase